MSILNSNAKEIHCKVIYYGPKGSGKTSCLNFIKKNSSKDKIQPLTIPIDPDLNAFTLSIGKTLGFDIFFHIYDISDREPEEKEILIRGVDGIVFVASADSNMENQNKESLNELKSILEGQGRDIFRIPLALQYNKSDLENTIDMAKLRSQINKYNNKDYQSSVVEGVDVIEPLKHVCKFILTSVRSGEML